MRVSGSKNQFASCSTRAGGDAVANDVTDGFGIDLPVQQFIKGKRFNPHQCFLAGNDFIVGKCHGNTHCSAGRSRYPNTVKNMQFTVVDSEFQLHFFAQFYPHQGGMTFQRFEQFRFEFFQRRAARIKS